MTLHELAVLCNNQFQLKIELKKTLAKKVDKVSTQTLSSFN
jgi:hypothetical protein